MSLNIYTERAASHLTLDVCEVDVDGVRGPRHVGVVGGEAAGAVVAVQAVVGGDGAGGREIVGVEYFSLGSWLVQEKSARTVKIVDWIRHAVLTAA